MAPPRAVRIGLLICGSLNGPVATAHGDYNEVYSRYWTTTLPSDSKVRVAIESYNIMEMEFPHEDRLDEYDLLMVTGSMTSAHDDSVPWVKELLLFLRGLIKNHPGVKLCGICFGHQIISRALGGECVPNKLEIGPTLIELSDVGKSVFGVDQLTLQQVHTDHVPVESFSKQLASGELKLVGSTGPAANQGIIKFYPSPKYLTKTHRNIHILTLQGHPEFSEGIITGLMRQAGDYFDHATKDDYWGHKGGHYDDEPTEKEGTGRRWQKTDGLDIVSRALWKMLGVIPSASISRSEGRRNNSEVLSAEPMTQSKRKLFSGRRRRLTDVFNHMSRLLRRRLRMAAE